MGILILILILFSVVVGVKHKAKNSEVDLPSCVMDGAKDFFGDAKVVISNLSKKKNKSKEDSEEGNSEKEGSESEDKVEEK